MNLVKATAIAFFLAMGATLVVVSVSAQQPTPLPHVDTGIPATTPPGWTAKQWSTLRAACQQIADKSAAHQPLTRGELRASEVCISLVVPPPADVYPSPISSNSSSAKTTPSPTPVPRGPAPQAAADPPLIGPIGSPFDGGSLDACTASPPDVATDVSPGSQGQIVQLLNSGLFVYNKQGNLLTTPEPLASFWYTLSPQSLTDTQVAWDPFSQRWLVTTLSLPQDKSNGDLFFAVSQSSNATMGWNFYKLTDNGQGVCSGFDQTHPTPDQPIMGYNQTWVAIVVRCAQAGGGTPGTDQLVLIPRINGIPAPQTSGQIQKANMFFNARPSRDISGIGDQPLFLVAPEVQTNILPFVQVTSVDVNGNFVGPGPGNILVHSPGNGVIGTSGMFAPAQHDTCGLGATCDVSLQDDRITSVILQIGNDGDHYLLTSFHAGDSTNNTVQALYFVGQVESFAKDSNGVGQWNGWYIGGPNFWAGYPTITMDDDFDIVSTFQTFYLNSNIYPNWYIDKGFIPNNNTFAQNPPSLGYGILDNTSRSSYYGSTNCTHPFTPPERWGDYMSTIWDSALGSPDEGSGFWTVQEYSNGGPSASPTPVGSNQSTQITRLAEPLPWFVGYNVPSPPTGEGPAGGGENECPHGTASNCNLTYSAPPGAQFGDVFVVVQSIGDIQNDTYLTHPTGWTLLKFQGGSHTIYANNGLGVTESFYVAVYVYGSQPNDTGRYQFKILPQVNGAETLGFLVAYRGASTSIPGNYLLYGKAGTGNSPEVVTPTLSPGNQNSPPSETTLLNVFNTECVGHDDPDVFGTFGLPSGSPFPTVETPLNSVDGFFAADVLVPTSGGTFGPYKSTVGCTGGRGLNTGISLVIPE